MSPNPSYRRGVEDFDRALRLLDHELAALGRNEPLPIRAIGGYALLKRGIRTGERAQTVDIDTVTADYDKAVRDAIRIVGERCHLDSDWLNNTCVFDDPDVTTMMIDARFDQDTSLNLNHIDLQIADLPTLTRSKLIAAGDAHLSGRSHDFDDLMRLLEAQNVTSFQELQERYPAFDSEDIEAGHNALREYFGLAPLPDSIPPQRWRLYHQK